METAQPTNTEAPTQRMKLVITTEDGTVLDSLDLEIGGELGYDLNKSLACQAVSAEIMDMIKRALAVK